MKKATILAAVLCLTASMGQASILEGWLTASTVSSAGQNYSVSIWLEIVPDAAKGETLASIARQGISDVGVSILTSDTHGVTQPLQASIVQPAAVATVFNTDVFDSLTVAAARQDGDSDGDLDALDAVGSDSGANWGVGVGTPVLLCTETWTETLAARATLHIVLDTKSRHWDTTDPLGDGSDRNSFSGFSTGVNHDGSDLVVGLLAAPEPATLALLALGAVGMIRVRRR